MAKQKTIISYTGLILLRCDMLEDVRGEWKTFGFTYGLGSCAE